MRVAVLSAGSPDWLQDIVWDGFVRLLGRENVHICFNETSTHNGRLTHVYEGFGGSNTFPIEDADFIIATTRTHIPEAIAKRGSRKIAILDGEDDELIREQYRSCAHVYFKRELLLAQKYPSNVLPISFAAIPEQLPPKVARTLQVGFA